MDMPCWSYSVEMEFTALLHEALKSIIMNKRWLNEVHKYLNFRYRRLYKKKVCRYMLYTQKTPKTYGYIPDLQTIILRRRLGGPGMPRHRISRPDDPRRYGLLPPVPPPTIEELMRTQVRRGFSRSSLSD
uniref:Uncharacterized protein n=1 Tax=Knipowitschia caucasica TaxID=637954 RepID=A0AAV2LM02_KNICA